RGQFFFFFFFFICAFFWLLWSPYLRCSPQMLRMKLPTKIPLENQPVRAGFFYAYN
ncbi:virulence protein, partial [Salmonella enterica subsp. enterica serovar Newport str. SHSN003]